MFEVIDRIHAAPTIAAVWDTYAAQARRVGLAYGLACFFPGDKSIGETTFAKTCPEDWFAHYVQEGHEHVDPVLSRVHQAIGAFHWSLKDWKGMLVGQQLSWASDLEAAGITRGLIIPDRRDGHTKLVAVFGSPDGIAIEDQRALHYAGLEAAMRMHELGLRPEDESGLHLSARESECLHWVAAGKSDWEIGVILSISEKTVATHIDRVKKKFGVASRAQVIVIALRKGLLQI